MTSESESEFEDNQVDRDIEEEEVESETEENQAECEDAAESARPAAPRSTRSVNRRSAAVANAEVCGKLAA